jgi:hypothetical protein
MPLTADNRSTGEMIEKYIEVSIGDMSDAIGRSLRNEHMKPGVVSSFRLLIFTPNEGCSVPVSKLPHVGSNSNHGVTVLWPVRTVHIDL